MSITKEERKIFKEFCQALLDFVDNPKKNPYGFKISYRICSNWDIFLSEKGIPVSRRNMALCSLVFMADGYDCEHFPFGDRFIDSYGYFYDSSRPSGKMRLEFLQRHAIGKSPINISLPYFFFGTMAGIIGILFLSSILEGF